MANTPLDNTKTIVDASVDVVKRHLEVSLQQLTRSANTAANKHGTEHAITVGYLGEARKLANMISNLKSA